MNKLITLQQLRDETRLPTWCLLEDVEWYEVDGVIVTTMAHVDAWKIEDAQLRQEAKELVRSRIASGGASDVL